MTFLESSDDTERVAYEYSQKSLNRWATVSLENKKKVTALLGKLQYIVKRRRSPNNNISDCLCELEGFSSDCGTHSKVSISHSRKVLFELSFTIPYSGVVYVQPIRGGINTRTKSVTFSLEKPVRISAHCVARLIQRLKTIDDTALLRQVFDACHLASAWELAAARLDATCWPALSKDGLFIAAREQSNAIVLITWLTLNDISAKWGRVAESLSSLKANNPSLLQDLDFQVAFIAAHPFMTARDQTTQQSDQHAELIRHIEEDEDSILDSPTKLPTRRSYLIGLNYREDLPDLSVEKVQSAVVATICPQGMTIVRLSNGLIAQIPVSLTTRAKKEGINSKLFDIGNSLDVLIVKIQKLDDVEAYRIIVEPKDLRDSRWTATLSDYPVNSRIAGSLTNRSGDGYLVYVRSGIRGFVTTTELTRHLPASALARVISLNSSITFEVTGHDDNRQLLQLAVAHVDDSLLLNSHSYAVGDRLICRCTYARENYALLQTEDGHKGILHQAENWDRPLPKVGDTIEVTAARISSDGALEFEGLPPPFVAEVFRLSESLLCEMPLPLGSITRAQIRGWLSASCRVLVHTEFGYPALIPWKEISWGVNHPQDAKGFFRLGEIIQAKVVKIIETNRKEPRIVLSVRALQPNPLDEFITNAPVGRILDGQIVKRVDYGYFVQLHPSNVTALLHKSATHSGTSTCHEIGAHIKVQVQNVDAESRRIGLKEF